MTPAAITIRRDRFALRTDTDVLAARRAVSVMGKDLELRALDCTKVATAASELARNAVLHGGGGTMLIELVRRGPTDGLRLTFEDSGPGIPDIDRALADGYSTAGGLGLGLGGARRLATEFAIASTVGAGTRVVIHYWKP